MAINISTDINVTTGGKLTDVGQIQGAWKTVDTLSDMYALTGSSFTKGKLQNGQVFYVSASAALYTLDIGGSFPFVTYNFNEFVWPGAETVELNTFTGSIQTEVNNLTAVTGSYSTTSSVNTISSSIAVDITALQSFSSSLDATFATEVELNTATASLSSSLAVDIANLTLDSGSYSTRVTSLESFSSSLDATFATDAEVLQAVSFLNAVTGSYAVTGSNTFTANQTINGILILTTQSVAPSVEPGGLYIDSSYNLWVGDNLV